jgi:enoyl-[acyl-carrier protein] reductase/trans-2-enoyl-CoA reductase (NAD+)
MVTTENVSVLSDIDGFREEFLRHHGFGMPGVDYSKDIRPHIF